MAGFELCPGCAAEYRDPCDRRFHAEPNACPVCGPQLSLIEAHGVPALARDPLAETLRRLQLGEIVAIKGLGGFHLACDAANPEAVARLREALENLKDRVEGIVMVYDRPFSRTDHEAIDTPRIPVIGEVRNSQVVFAYDEDRKRDAQHK